MPQPCVVCRAKPGPVCHADQALIDRMLAEIPRRLAAVANALTPSRAQAGERVGVSAHVHSSAPARINALSLVGPGGDVPASLHPQVRHWHATRLVDVVRIDGGRAYTVRVKVVDWFSEIVLGTDGNPVIFDDQIGVVPPREWLDMQVRRWRAHFGHHVPARTRLGPQRAYLPAAYRTLLRLPDGARTVGFLLAAHAASGAHARLAYRGLLAYETTDRDPAIADLERRGHAMGWDIDYLRTWLAEACGEEGLDLAAFVAQLTALHAEIARVLGDTPDREWVGRCPAFIADVDADGEPAGRKRPCGAGLWQENGAYVSAQVVCPRCRSTWETRGHAGAGTAREIRRVWPIDRRRRYTADQIDRITAPRCVCGKRVKVEWRDVTGTQDRQRTWQPVGAHCPDGHEEARWTV